MCDVYGDACFRVKYICKYDKPGFLQKAWVEKTVYRVKTLRVSGKENVLGTVVSKIGYVGCLLGHKRTHHYCKETDTKNIICQNAANLHTHNHRLVLE